MTATPLPPRPKPAFKLNYDSKSGWYFVSEPGVGDTWCFTSYQLDDYAIAARADLEAENANLRLELQSARDINLAVVNRQQAEIEALRKKLAQARKDEADALRAADAVYEAQERAGDAYRAGSSGY